MKACTRSFMTKHSADVPLVLPPIISFPVEQLYYLPFSFNGTKFNQKKANFQAFLISTALVVLHSLKRLDGSWLPLNPSSFMPVWFVYRPVTDKKPAGIYINVTSTSSSVSTMSSRSCKTGQFVKETHWIWGTMEGRQERATVPRKSPLNIHSMI